MTRPERPNAAKRRQRPDAGPPGRGARDDAPARPAGQDAAAAPARAGEAGAGEGLFLVAAPGLEEIVAAEARALGLDAVRAVPGGAEAAGDLAAAMRANLHLRTTGRVLLRLAAFRALHPAQLDKRARRVDWRRFVAEGTPVRVEATCRRSRIYHAGAAADRVRRALVEEAGAVAAGEADTPAGGALTIMVRLDDDLCTLSLDTSGAALHRRGLKQAVAKAPMRETMAAAFLRAAGHDGREPVLDPMCGSGTFLVEAGEIAAGLAPGRAREFAFERLACFDAAAFEALRAEAGIGGQDGTQAGAETPDGGPRLFGFDRDAGAVEATAANLARAGLDGRARLACQPVSALVRPEGPPGLVIVNPPYGGRVGQSRTLTGLYATLGRVLAEGFGGWRVALVTTRPELARATGLPFMKPGPPVAHGGLKVTLWQTRTLG